MILVKPCFGCLRRRKRAAFQRLAREEKVSSLLWAAGEPQQYAAEPHVPAAIPSVAVFYQLRQLYRQHFDDSTGN